MTIKGINLIPEDVRFAWRLKRLRAFLTAFAFLYLLTLALIFMSQRTAVAAKKAQMNALIQQKEMLIANSAQYSELQARHREIQTTETELKKRLEAAAGLAEKSISWAAVLRRLSRDMPENVWLKSITTSDDEAQGKTLKFMGSSTTSRGVADFLFMLENSPHFHNAALSYSQKKDFDKTTVHEFEITAGLKRTEETVHEW